MSTPRVLVFTVSAPSSSAASAQVLERLTSGTEAYLGYVHRKNEDQICRGAESSARFPVENAFGSVSKVPFLWRFEQFGWHQAAVHTGLKQTYSAKWDVVLACHPSMAFSLAAAKVAQSRKLPMVLYLMDLFAESRVNPFEKLWAWSVEKKLMEQASAVICLTQGLQRYYGAKYHINPILIPHCVTEAEIAEAIACKPELKVGSPVIVTYAGGVYQARLDSLILVKQAIEDLNAQGFPSSLLILGKNDPTQLAGWGLGGPYVNTRFIADRNEFLNQLRHSDILLSTIAFKSAYPLQDQTCFPTKTFDYFLAGKPVLVVAAELTDYVGYLKQNAAAMTVTFPDANMVARNIRQLATDEIIRRDLVDAGFRLLDHHHQNAMQGIFDRTLSQTKTGEA